MFEYPENIHLIEVMFPRGAFVVRKFCDSYTSGRILDVGCGKGTITKLIGKSFDVELLGVDTDKSEIEKATNSNKYSNIKFACVDIKEIKDRFTGILLIEVLEHIETPFDFLKHINKLCDPDGFLILTVPNGYSLKEVIGLVVYRFKRTPGLCKLIDWYKRCFIRKRVFNESPHVQHFTLSKIRSAISDSGFTIQDEFYGDIWSGFLWMYFPWIPIPKFLRKLERKLSNYIPYFLLGDWGFYCKKKSEGLMNDSV